MTYSGYSPWDGGRANVGIKLNGRTIYDDSDEGGLFVGNPPELEQLPEIEWVRIGDERRPGWGKNFKLVEKTISDVLEDKQGCFYVRIYEEKNPIQKSDSVEFRYVRDLNRIEVNGEEYSNDTVLLPISTGNPGAEIHLVGQGGVSFKPELSPESLKAGTKVNSHGIVEVPANPDADRVVFHVLSRSEPAKVVLDLPRLWWRLEDDDPDSAVWYATPLQMTQKEFEELARAGAELLLLSKRHDSVSVGFEDKLDRQYRRNIADSEINIPLRPFADYAEFDQNLNTDLHFNVNWAGHIVNLLVIRPQPTIDLFKAAPSRIAEGEEVKIEWVTQNAHESSVTLEPDFGEVEESGSRTTQPIGTTQYTLTVSNSNDTIMKTVTVTVGELHRPIVLPIANVKVPHGGWRAGRGFSKFELDAVGLTLADANTLCIPIDKRRRSTHERNIIALRSVIDA